MSENGPREGTRDLPRPSPDAGRRTVDNDSLAGTAYGSLARSLRRRHAELVELVKTTGSTAAALETYHDRHPLEPKVTDSEIEAAAVEAGIPVSRPLRPHRKSRTSDER